jgi:hypothetical protein
MHNSYSNLSLRQLHAELTKAHELFLKSLREHKPKEFINQAGDKVNALFKAIEVRLNAFKKFRTYTSIDLRRKEAFLKVLV